MKKGKNLLQLISAAHPFYGSFTSGYSSSLFEIAQSCVTVRQPPLKLNGYN